ncbi:ABC transporter ATP-binding protein [Actinopolymorpha pittospori]|uniref:Peptide/nickel transport system ATP-binding protein n=1 Tax=Actinopolymorpha pittospori TaxID=648752 RepID=A0A927MPH5_9ACTN|nr:ABC transporter ATP-binding protein [Actinopolymorpha pittospori]MBE1603689.1 peptide/nickel transport system ATP-binding protein [Actinopolymorpha pittospori]
MGVLMEVREVSKRFGGGVFGGRHVVGLDGVSFTVDEEHPSITTVVGESGSGKTTFARLMLGVTSPTSGEVLYRGTDIARLSKAQRKRFRRDVQVVFQDPYDVYNPFYKVDHVLKTTVARFGLARSGDASDELIEEALTAIGLRPESTLGRYPHQLSGGQRQRIMVARALLVRPALIVADEPVSMVDASMRASILRTLRRLKTDFGISVVYITHDLTTAYQVGDQMIVLYKGMVAEAGNVDSVVHDPKHPYTQLLLRSVPLPDPDAGWSGDTKPTRPRRAPGGESCAFVDRCGFAMDVCVERMPPLYRTEPHRTAACFRYEGAPVMARGELRDVLTARAEAEGG